jgi:hypothetical protein
MLVGLVSPYLQQDPVYLGGKIGFIWGAVSMLTVVWVYFVVPELKVRKRDSDRASWDRVAEYMSHQGRKLEEIDFMYNNNVPARKMSTYVMPVESSVAPQALQEEDEKGDFKGEFEHNDVVNQVWIGSAM